MAVEELVGRIPDGWTYTTLGKACADGGGDIQTGPFGSQLHAADYVPSGVPSIMPQNIGDNRISEYGIARITPEDATRLSRYLVREGDIVYSRRGDVEKRALIRANETGWLCGTGCLRVRLGDKGANPSYAAYYLGHPSVREWIVRHAHGATMPNLNTSILSSCPFVISPPAEQRAIAHILGTLDDKTELNRRRNQTLEAMARALFKDWFVDFGPVRARMEGREPYLPADLWQIFPERLDDEGKPEGWQTRGVYDFAKVIYGAPFSSAQFNTEGAGIPLIRIRDLNTHEPCVYTEEKHPKGHLIKAGDIVVGMDGEFRLHVWKGEPAWLNQRVCHFEPLTGVPGSYLIEALKEPLSFFERGKVGTTVIHLGKSDIDTFKLLHPGVALLGAFGEIADALVAQAVGNAIESRTLAQLRDTLLPKLISGELRIADAEKFVERARI